ncbi:MAG: hypothetical protein FWG10_00155 [Eubacteriaceae bacterium]|nr:hypothetical protein [Eubacteriaceae bacterium]
MEEKIKDILITELDYSKYVAEMTAEDLCNLQPPLDGIRDAWLADRSISDIVVEGFSVSNLLKAGFTFPSALIAMDWLMDEPDIAKEELASELFFS